MNNKKIICFLNGVTENKGKPSISGGDVRALKILQEFSEKGMDIVVFTSSIGVELVDQYRRDNWEVVDIGTKEGGSIMSRFNRVWRALVVVRQFSISNFQFPFKSQTKEFVSYSSSEHLYDVLPAWWMAWRKKIEWVALIHWVPDSPWSNNRGNTPFLHNLIYYIQNFVSHLMIKNQAKVVLAVSDITRDKLEKIGFEKNKLGVVYCGVDLKKIQNVEAGNEKKYDGVFLKRLNPGKGSYDLVKIWQKVVERKPEAKFVIIGDGPDEVVEKIRKEITEKGLDKNIILHGPEYDFQKKFQIMKQSKVFVLPTYEENWAIVIGEALAAGLPVVCYDLPEIRPIWNDSVDWVEKGNTEKMADRIVELIDSGYVQTRLPEVVTEYSWENIAEKELEFFLGIGK